MRMGLGIFLGMASGGGDSAAPALLSAVVDGAGTTITLTYGEALDTGSIPASGASSLAGTARTVSSVAVSGSAVTLTLSGEILPGVTGITVSYTPGGAPIQDLAGNDAAALVAQAVTNNSTFGVNPVTSGLILELDSSDTYITYNGSDRISAWNDKSGTGNHGSTAAGLPLRVTGVLDGKNAVRFDATSCRIGRTALVGGARGAACTVVLVLQKTTNTGAQVLCGQAASSTTYAVRTDTAKWGIQQSTTQSEAGSTANTSPHIVIATFGSTDTLHVDDMTTALVSANAGTVTADGWFLGRSSSGGLFDCFAHLIYDRGISGAERASLKTYLRQVYPSLPA